MTAALARAIALRIAIDAALCDVHAAYAAFARQLARAQRMNLLAVCAACDLDLFDRHAYSEWSRDRPDVSLSVYSQASN